jgi:hypothetical protein
MSKLLRLPFALLAVLALFLLSPGIAAADPPTNLTASDCLANPGTDGCSDLLGYDDTAGPGPLASLTQARGGEGPTVPQPESPQRAKINSELSQQAVDSPVCDRFPDLPICDDSTEPPTVPPGPLTCDDLAELLGIPGGCPDSFTCQDLADLLGVTCPEGPPDCEALAAMLGLPVSRCPSEPPGSCEEFAALLGLEGGCSDIPCLDISQVPPEARAGLKPLLDGLEQIGVKACPAKPATPPAGGNTPGGGTSNPITSSGSPGVYYANCDDARAKGAAPVYAASPGYRPELDSDHDGIGCEVDTVQAVAAAQPNGTLAYTGADLEGLIRLGAILVSGGTLVLLAGVRRA